MDEGKQKMKKQCKFKSKARKMKTLFIYFLSHLPTHFTFLTIAFFLHHAARVEAMNKYLSAESFDNEGKNEKENKILGKLRFKNY